MSAPRPEAATPPPAPAKPRGGSSWGARSFNRDGAKLKLMGSLRGDGLLILADRSISAAYELDIYGRNGGTRSASGHLEGDFAALVDADAPAARLRLSDGVEFEIELTDLEADLAEFETRGDLPAGVKVAVRA